MRGSSCALCTYIVLSLVLLAGRPLSNNAQTPLARVSDDTPPEVLTEREGQGGANILKRIEWFEGTRQSTTCESPGEMRWKAIRSTREAMRIQAERAEEAGEAMPLWVSRGPTPSNFEGYAFGQVSGRVIALAKDPVRNILYAGAASGGLWKSADDGQTWTSLFDQVGTLSVGAIAIDPNDPFTIYAGTGEVSRLYGNYGCGSYWGLGLFASYDGGQHWNKIAVNPPLYTNWNPSTVCAVLVDPSNSQHIVVGATNTGCSQGTNSEGGIVVTMDGGATWNWGEFVIPGDTLWPAKVADIAQDPVDHNVYYATMSSGFHSGEYGGLYRSADGGFTWHHQTCCGLPVGNLGRSRIAVSPADHNVVYVLFGQTSPSQLWRSIDQGATWTQVSSGGEACDGQCWYNLVIAPDRFDPEVVYRGNILIYRSSSGGAAGSWVELNNGSWGTQQKIHQDTQALLVDPTAPDTLYAGCDGGVWKLTLSDGGATRTYANLNGDLNVTQFYGIANHPSSDDIILGGSQDNSVLRRTSCDAWDLAKMTGDGMQCAVNPVEPRYVYVEGYPSALYGTTVPWIYRSDTGIFGNFSLITAHIPDAGTTSWVTPYTLDPRNPSQLFLGMNKIYVSQDRGDTWTTTSDPLGGNAACVSVSPVSGGPVFAGVGGKVFMSPNGMYDWASHSSGLPGGPVNDVKGDPSNALRALCAIGGFQESPASQLYEYAASTNAWVARGAGLPFAPATSIVMLSSTEVFLGTDVGVYKSTDGGAHFTAFCAGLPLGVPVVDLKYNPVTHTLTAGTYGRGAWQVSLGAPGESSNVDWSYLKWAFGSKNRMTWGTTFGAEGYRVYRGDAAQLPNLPTGATVCKAFEGGRPTTGPLLTAVPDPGTFYWYVLTAYNGHGEGGAGSGSGGSARVLNSSGSCETP